MPHSADPLPPFYYHDHFMEMIRFVTTLYGDFLEPVERQFIEGFKDLSLNAQCLFIRMINRKRAVFHPEDLDYAEIEMIGDAHSELLDRGYSREMDERDYASLLGITSKDRLLGIAELHDQDVRASWAKKKLCSHIQQHLEYHEFIESLELSGYIVPSHRETVAFLLYLYFGKLNDNLTSFTLRDLGLVRVRGQDTYRARFQTIAEARAAFFYTTTLQDLKKADTFAFEDIANRVAQFPEAVTEFIADLRDTILFKLGQFFEKRKNHVRALEIYSLSGAFECNERAVRLLHALGETDQVKARLNDMISNPVSDEEHIFATDFYNRKFGLQRIGVYTDLLRSSQSIEIDDLFRSYPEDGAIAYFERQGWTAYHTENGLWPTLFGLIFWDELFETKGAFSSDFDRLPSFLRDNSFASKFSIEIDYKLMMLTEGSAMPRLLETITRHYGQENDLFNWFEGIDDFISQLIKSSPSFAVAGIIRRMAHDFKGHRDGFPDLMLLRDNRIKFIEIKAEGDQIRRNQLARLNLLRQVGFEAEVCQVKYIVDPDQTYVVVDVETTGRMSPYGRITEIAAVKVRNGEVMEKWQSLINPECRIPAMITELTGITNEMVADAPVFADIADELEGFINGSIFVAHNVNFDHGFIAIEYQRLDRHFRHPKLCTCAAMRRHFPGHSSYGLANLSREYGIKLTNHHRALADAEAATELLNLVNEKRQQNCAA